MHRLAFALEMLARGQERRGDHASARIYRRQARHYLWVPYIGPYGGRGWRNPATGRIRYEPSGRHLQAHLLQPNDGQALACEYASLFSAVEAAGVEVPPLVVERADRALAYTAYRVDRTEDAWAAVLRSSLPSVRYRRRGRVIVYEARRAPAGGIWIAGREYRGGQFIPGDAIAQATPAERRELDRRKAAEDRPDRLRRPAAAASPDAAGDDPSALRPTPPDERGRARAAACGRVWRAAGVNPAEAAGELFDLAAAALTAVDDADPDSKRTRARLRLHLGRLALLAGRDRPPTPEVKHELGTLDAPRTAAGQLNLFGGGGDRPARPLQRGLFDSLLPAGGPAGDDAGRESAPPRPARPLQRGLFDAAPARGGAGDPAPTPTPPDPRPTAPQGAVGGGAAPAGGDPADRVDPAPEPSGGGEPPAAADAATPADAGRDGPGDRDGGADGAGDRGDDPVQLPDPDARIVTARADLTATADPRLVPEECRRHLSRHGIEGAALAIAALEKHGGFLLADGTGAGKTRQILSVSKHFAGRGKKVLIVTKNQIIKPDWEAGTVDGSFRDDGELLGVRPLANQGDRPLAPGQVHITTYERLGDAAHLADKDTVVIFDESHALKNASSQVARHGFGMADKAFAVLYSSATPEDKPMHIAHLFRARVFGDKDPAETYSRLGLLQRGGEPGPDGQLTPATWVVDPRVGAAEVYRRLDGLFRQLTREGLMVKRELGMKGVDVGFRRIELPPEADEVAGKIAAALANAPDDLGPRVARLRRDLNALRDQLKAAPDDQALRSRVHAAADELATEQDKLTRGAEGIGKATLLMHLRRQQEPFKVPHAVAAAKAELDEGRQVVIFCSRINTSKVRKKVVTGYDVDDDGRTRPVYGYEDVHESEGTAKLLKEALAAEGVTDVAELHGNAEDESPEAMKRFQTGRARVVIATMESGGTGINLDDVTGSRPRTMLVLTAPFSAVENVQAAGRVWRMSTKSAPRVRYLFSDSAVDRWNAAIIATKMDSLGAGVSGEVDRLKVPVGELQGAEALEMARAAENEPPHPLGPFEWGALTGTVDTPPAEDVGFNYYRVDPRGYYEIAFDKGAYEQLPLSTRGTIHWLFKFDRRRGAWVSKAPAVAMTADQLKAAARVAAAAGLKPRGGASFDPPATRPPVAPPPVPPPTPTPTPPPAGQSPAATPGDALIERVDRREAEFAGRVQKYRPAVVADGGRVSVTFATRPTPDVRESLKARGFRFDGSGWSARLTPEVRSWVERFTGAALPPPAAAPAPPPPRPPDPAKGPPPVNARRVPTARGERLAHDFTPSEGLWRAREDGLLPSSVSVYRDTRTGRWQARVYGQTEADIGRDLQRLAELGAYQCSRFRRACLRQAAAARGRGDVASARIYLRQAAVASRR